MHVISGGLSLLKCDLSYQTLSLTETLEHIQGCLDNETDKTDDDWLEVVNMDYAGLVSKSGTVGKKQLDKLSTKRPVFIRSSDYHTVLANSRALELSGIDENTKDPVGGKVDRLPGSKEPSGSLQDGARDLIKVPPPSDAENLEAARAALKLLREAGITTFQEAAAADSHHDVFDTIRKEDGLSARGYFDYWVEAPDSVDGVPALVKNVTDTIKPRNDKKPLGPKPSLKWQAIKAFIDGVITYPSNTAALIEPYWAPVDASNESGTWVPDKKSLNDPYWKPAVLTKTLESLFLAGIDAQLHVDGDLAVRIALDAAESFRKKHPGKDIRLGLAHDELSHQDDWGRFAKLGVDPIVSYQWSQLSSFYIPNTFNSIAEYRLNNLQAWAQIEKRGRPLVYGSDWPVSLTNPVIQQETNNSRLIPLTNSSLSRLQSLAQVTQKTPTRPPLKALPSMVSSPAVASHAHLPYDPSPSTVPASSAPTSRSAHWRRASWPTSLCSRTTSSRSPRRSLVVKRCYLPWLVVRWFTWPRVTTLVSRPNFPTMIRLVPSWLVAPLEGSTPRSCQRRLRRTPQSFESEVPAFISTRRTLREGTEY